MALLFSSPPPDDDDEHVSSFSFIALDLALCLRSCSMTSSITEVDSVEAEAPVAAGPTPA